MTYRKWWWMIPIGIVAVLVLGFVGGHVVRLLWNWLIPPISGWSEITFWQALGLLVLSRILFGGRGGHWFGPPRHRFTREQRERFRERMRARFCDNRSLREDDEPPAGTQT
jgi:hypothetical protein